MKELEFSILNGPSYVKSVLRPHGPIFARAVSELDQDTVYNLLNISQSCPVRLYSFYNLGACQAGFCTLAYEDVHDKNGNRIGIQPVQITPTSFKKYDEYWEYDNNLRDTAKWAFDAKRALENTSEFGRRSLVAIAMMTGRVGNSYKSRCVGQNMFSDNVYHDKNSGIGMCNVIVYNQRTQIIESHPYGWVEAYNCELNPRNYPELYERNKCAAANTMNSFLCKLKYESFVNLYAGAYQQSKTK